MPGPASGSNPKGIRNTPRRCSSRAYAAAPQNPDSGCDASKPQHKRHSTDGTRVDLMAGEFARATARVAGLVEREAVETVEHEHPAYHA